MQQSVEAGRAGASELELPEHKSPEAKCESRSHGASEDALRMHLAPTHRRVLLRLPAILITFSIEMVVAFVISRYEETLVKYPLLISFQPVVSAVSGNVGLQSSSIVIRNLALGLNSERKMRQAMRPEIKAGFLMASIMGVVVGLTAFIWYSPWLAAAHTWRGSASFAFTVCLGVFFSMVAAAISGSAAPLLTKRCGFDPSAMGGPMETAFQDAVGGTLLVALSGAILGALGDQGKQCPGGDANGCIQLCRLSPFNGTAAIFDSQCINSCLRAVAARLC